MPDSQANFTTSPDLAILLAGSYRILTDRLGAAMERAQLGEMRPAFGFVIRALAARPLTVSEIAGILDVTKQAASQTIDEMERAGFVERRASETDRRVREVALTAKGRRVRQAALRESARLEEELVAAHGAEAVAAARTVLTGLVAAHGDVEHLAARRSRAVWR